MRSLNEILVWGAFLSWLTFVVWYVIRAKWWRSSEGRNLMGVGATLTVALGLIVLAYTWPDWPGRTWVVPLVYAAFIGFGIQRTIQLERHQRRRQRDR